MASAADGYKSLGLIGLGSGIGKSLEPENILKIKETVNMLRWDDDLKKEKDSTNKNLTQSFKDYFKLVNPPTIVNPANGTSKPAIQTLDTASTQISITGVGAPTPQPIEMDPTLTKLLNAEDALRVATRQNNAQKVQVYGQQVQDLQNQMNSNVQGRAIEAIQLQDPDKFHKVLFDYYASKRQQIPEEYRRPGKFGTSKDGSGEQVPSFIFSGGVDSSGKPLPETSLTTLDLYAKFTGRLEAMMGGSGSSAGSRRGQGTSGDSAFFAFTAGGDKIDATSTVNGLMDSFYSGVRMRGTPSSNDEKVALLMDALTLQGANPKLMEILQKTNIDVEDLFKDKSLSRALLRGLRLDDGEGNVIFNDPNTEALAMNAIKTVSVTDADGVIKTESYLDIGVMAQKHKGWLERVSQIKQDTASIDNIKKSFATPFPTSITNGTKEDVRKAQQQWFKDLSVHIMKTTDFQNMDVPTSYSIAQQILDDNLRSQPKSNNLTDSTSKDSGVKQSPSSSNEPSFLSSLYWNGKPVSNEFVQKVKGIGARISDGLGSFANDMWKDDPDRKPIGADPLYFRASGDYDYPRAAEAGIVPDKDGKMGSVAAANKRENKLYKLPPGSYVSIKGPDHPTLDKSIESEATAEGGPRRPVQSTTNGKIFFIPQSAALPPNMIEFKIKTPSSPMNSENQSSRTQPSSNDKVPLNERNNNPGALEYRGQRGATSDGRFAIFQTPQDGFNALVRQIKLDGSRGHSLSSFIQKYAPKSENKTEQYIDFVSGKTGIGSYEKIAGKDIESIALAVTEMEGGKRSLNYFKNNISLTSQNAQGKPNQVIPMAMMNISGSRAKTVEGMFDTALSDIEGIYKTVQNSLSPTGKKSKVSKNNSTVPFVATIAGIIDNLGKGLTLEKLEKRFSNKSSTAKSKTAIGKPIDSLSSSGLTSILRPLPPPLKFLIVGGLKALEYGDEDKNYSNIIGRTDVQAFVEVLKGRKEGPGAVAGADWNATTDSKWDLANRQFAYGGFSYNIAERNKDGYPIKFTFKDTYDFNNSQRRLRVEQVEKEKASVGFYQAFKDNWERSLKHVRSPEFTGVGQPIYEGSSVEANWATELFSRTVGEFFLATGKGASFDSEITVDYDKNNKVTDYKIIQIPIVRKIKPVSTARK